MSEKKLLNFLIPNFLQPYGIKLNCFSSFVLQNKWNSINLRCLILMVKLSIILPLNGKILLI